jgi:molecular chaperone DnaJ
MKKRYAVEIPAGIDNGQSILKHGLGEPGINGGPRGDVRVEVMVGRHPIFQRQEFNIYSTVPMPFTVAALGGDIVIDTVHGKVIYEVKPGTQTDTKIRLKGKGVPTLRNKEVCGDHYVTLVVQVPDRLSNEAKDVLRQFDTLTGDALRQAQNISASSKEPDGSKKGKDKKPFWGK